MPEPLAILSESTITDRYQTTVPEAVRKVLGLSKRDKIHYNIHTNGQVTITRADSTETTADPVVGKFLDFLAQSMATDPQHIQVIDPSLLQSAQSLVVDMVIDLDAPLPDDE